MLTELGVINQVQSQQPRRAEDRKAFDYIFVFRLDKGRPTIEILQLSYIGCYSRLNQPNELKSPHLWR
jgi:hypothetical protein